MTVQRCGELNVFTEVHVCLRITDSFSSVMPYHFSQQANLYWVMMMMIMMSTLIAQDSINLNAQCGAEGVVTGGCVSQSHLKKGPKQVFVF